MTNYKEKITNELMSHRDKLIQECTKTIVYLYNSFDKEWTMNTEILSRRGAGEWFFYEHHRDNDWFAISKSEKYEWTDPHHYRQVRDWDTNQMVKQHIVRTVRDITFRKFMTKEEVIKLAEKKATEKVDNMLSYYKQRLHEKLDDTNEAQPITKLEIVSFAIHDVYYPKTRVIVEVQNGAKCELTTKVVWKVSVNGNEYFQMPTTFHNAFDPKGRKVARPSFEAFAYAICDNKEAYTDLVRVRKHNEAVQKDIDNCNEKFLNKFNQMQKMYMEELNKHQRNFTKTQAQRDSEKGRKEIAEYISSRVA